MFGQTVEDALFGSARPHGWARIETVSVAKHVKSV